MTEKPYICVLCGTTPEMAQNAVKSIIDTGYPVKIIILNNTEKDLRPYFVGVDVQTEDAPVKLTMAQTANWANNVAIREGQNKYFCMPDDSTITREAFEKVMEKYEEVKNEKWLSVCIEIFGLNNVNAYLETGIKWDTFLFPIYWCDIHYYRLMGLRGWKMFVISNEGLVTHIGSYSLKSDQKMKLKNDLTCQIHEQIYQKIWGGGIGNETVNDPTVGGMYE